MSKLVVPTRTPPTRLSAIRKHLPACLPSQTSTMGSSGELPHLLLHTRWGVSCELERRHRVRAELKSS